MKNLYLTLAVLTLAIFSLLGQNQETMILKSYEDSLHKVLLHEMDSIITEKLVYEDSINDIVSSYGMQVSQFKTSDGFASSTEVSYFIKCHNRSLELGIYFSDETKVFEGLSFSHKYFILRKKFNENTIIEPYLMYSLIYRITYLDAPLSMYPERACKLFPGKARYASLEHYFGAGVEMNFFKYIYINGSVGFGRYLGSIKKPCYPDEFTGIYDGGDGWGGIYKIGIGIRIP